MVRLCNNGGARFRVSFSRAFLYLFAVKEGVKRWRACGAVAAADGVKLLLETRPFTDDGVRVAAVGHCSLALSFLVALVVVCALAYLFLMYRVFVLLTRLTCVLY